MRAYPYQFSYVPVFGRSIQGAVLRDILQIANGSRYGGNWIANISGRAVSRRSGPFVFSKDVL